MIFFSQTFIENYLFQIYKNPKLTFENKHKYKTIELKKTHKQHTLCKKKKKKTCIPKYLFHLFSDMHYNSL